MGWKMKSVEQGLPTTAAIPSWLSRPAKGMGGTALCPPKRLPSTRMLPNISCSITLPSGFGSQDLSLPPGTRRAVGRLRPSPPVASAEGGSELLSCSEGVGFVFRACLGRAFQLLGNEQHRKQASADDINIKDKGGSCQALCWKGSPGNQGEHICARCLQTFPSARGKQNQTPPAPRELLKPHQPHRGKEF